MRAGLLWPAIVGFLVLVLVATAAVFRPGGDPELTAAKPPVDTTPPATVVTFPAAGGAYRSSAWAAGCSPAGICGTASDASGVTSVKVAILQASSGKYWNGTSFSLASRTFQAANGTTSWKYAFGVPADGAYTVYVQATDAVDNTTTAASAPATGFTIDNASPPMPTLTKTPADPSDTDKAQFNWKDAESGVTYKCGLDGATPAPCSSSGVEYTTLDPGDHCFAVTALDAAGNSSSARTFCWTVAGGKAFTIAGDASALFAPAVQQRLDLRLTNANNFTIRVTDITVTVKAATIKAGVANPACNGTSNMGVVQQFVGPVDVPANSTKTLSQLAVPLARRPLVEMKNLSTNQDACKSTTFTFEYSGTAVKP